MGSRYKITGVQLGMLVALPDQKDRQELVDKICDEQYLGTAEEVDPRERSDNAK